MDLPASPNFGPNPFCSSKWACLDFSSSNFQMESHILSTGGITLRVLRWLDLWRSSRRLGRISKPTRPGWVQFESRERESGACPWVDELSWPPIARPPPLESSRRLVNVAIAFLSNCLFAGARVALFFLFLRFVSALLPPQATEIRLLQVFTRSLSQGLLYQPCLSGSSVSQSHTFTSEDNERTILMFCMCDMDM
jgi:hypothetical protein